MPATNCLTGTRKRSQDNMKPPLERPAEEIADVALSETNMRRRSSGPVDMPATNCLTGTRKKSQDNMKPPIVSPAEEIADVATSKSNMRKRSSGPVDMPVANGSTHTTKRSQDNIKPPLKRPAEEIAEVASSESNMRRRSSGPVENGNGTHGENGELHEPAKKRRKVLIDPIFGEIPGVKVGDWWATRARCAEDQVHPADVQMNTRTDEGCFSLILNGAAENDEDFGDHFVYTGSYERDPKEKAKLKNRGTNSQTRDQVFQGKNAALALNVPNRKPVRVVRGYNLASKYAPEWGYRYDGLYSVEKAWLATGVSNFKVCKFALHRLKNQAPPPWLNNLSFGKGCTAGYDTEDPYFRGFHEKDKFEVLCQVVENEIETYDKELLPSIQTIATNKRLEKGLTFGPQVYCEDENYTKFPPNTHQQDTSSEESASDGLKQMSIKDFFTVVKDISERSKDTTLEVGVAGKSPRGNQRDSEPIWLLELSVENRSLKKKPPSSTSSSSHAIDTLIEGNLRKRKLQQQKNKRESQGKNVTGDTAVNQEPPKPKLKTKPVEPDSTKTKRRPRKAKPVRINAENKPAKAQESPTTSSPPTRPCSVVLTRLEDVADPAAGFDSTVCANLDSTGFAGSESSCSIGSESPEFNGFESKGHEGSKSLFYSGLKSPKHASSESLNFLGFEPIEDTQSEEFPNFQQDRSPGFTGFTDEDGNRSLKHQIINKTIADQ